MEFLLIGREKNVEFSIVSLFFDGRNDIIVILHRDISLHQ